MSKKTQTKYEDTEYVPGAEYQVRARRVYDTESINNRILTRISEKVAASVTVIPKQNRIEGVQHNVETYNQSEYLDVLYGGNYTFSTEAKAPGAELALDQTQLS